ncbi:hypothetical protein DFQ28_010973 [Apophysomyces sp. BC1034]|nr:hypothetical protein DFQ30_009641 [Apophysomyces sp. BC1015]KAG0191763.1 hypothetical protein DFQ28_010973 [Apophysomyces sp. BC1034]
MKLLDDDLLVPQEVRVANRILKNAGFAPPGVGYLRALEDTLRGCDVGPQCAAHGSSSPDRAERSRLRAKWLALNMALESLRGGPMVVPREYCRRVAERLAGCGGAAQAAAD